MSTQRRGAAALGRIAVAAAGGVVALYWLAEVARHALRFDPRGDFAIFYGAGRAVLSGTSPYTATNVYSPPWVTVWMAPFSIVPPESAQVVWTVASLALLALTGWPVWRMAGRGVMPAAVLAVALLAVSLFYPLRQMLDSAKTDDWAVTATALFVYLDSTERPFLAGLSLTLGLLNPHLIIGPCVYPRVRGRWRAIAGG